jgi:hypothetical protein
VLAREFLDAHLGRWLAPWGEAVRESGTAWVAVAELARELTESHRAELPAGSAPWELPGALPAPEELGVWGIARTLARPACSGWLPMPQALDRLGEAASVPSGVGERTGRLELLLRSAGLAGTVPALLQAMQRELRSWARALPDTPWARRAQQTEAWLALLLSALDRPRSEP